MRFSLFSQLVVWFSQTWGILMCLNIESAHIHSCQCLNDYLFTIRCELNMTSETRPHDALYWLEFYDEREPFVCVLTSQTDPWVCVMNLSTRVEGTFTDTNLFQISFNYSLHGNNNSFVLKNFYKPVDFIQPVPPSNLTLLWKPDEAVFHWLSGYDESIMLVSKLRYQLSIQRKGGVFEVESFETNMSVPVSTFAAYTDYTAHVRSVPHQIHYRGVWSHWGPAISWTTGPINETVSSATVWMALFVLPVILLFYFSYTRCKRCVLNPSPAPHIGDFKCSIMLPEKVGDLLQREESLQIDNLIEEPNPAQLEKTNDVNDGSNHASFTGSPRSPSMLQSSVDSKVSMGSWTQTWMSAEKGSVTYSDEYCTLSYPISE
ncbi:interleukin-4 receptor subunit alpha isoform X2 [Hemibagrus wyckioides]|uniref:interleukin-4 receptor subunit alpha isoform X2 n=1 Tax=Hemibagrus wyckioides TaxID=337641 RepID=UPI00266C79EC|nr:interleukin-4 receptor subunit alpha isoform X2 [Hemibagrus wyckioides]